MLFLYYFLEISLVVLEVAVAFLLRDALLRPPYDAVSVMEIFSKRFHIRS